MLKKPTIRDVAKSAGVSIATVSFVLNDRPGQAISQGVKDRVTRAARKLNYHATATAAGLARKRTHNITIVSYWDERLISNQFYSFVIEGAVKEVIQHPYNLMFSFLEAPYRGYADLPKVFRESNAEGALFIQRVHQKLIKDIRARGIPVVAIDHYPPVKDLDSLQIDNHTGGVLAARHLLELGHKHIGAISAVEDRPSIRQRLAGFTTAMRAARVPFSHAANVYRSSDLKFEAGYERALAVLKKKNHPTALFCVNDEVAAGTLRAARARGLSVPRDLSVVGFDDITMANYTDPPLTTVGVDKEDLGARAIRRLIELVESRGKPRRARSQTVPVRLVVRESSAAPPASGRERGRR